MHDMVGGCVNAFVLRCFNSSEAPAAGIPHICLVLKHHKQSKVVIDESEPAVNESSFKCAIGQSFTWK